MPKESALGPAIGVAGAITAFALGCLWIVVMMVQVFTLDLDARVKSNLLRLGLFWHFLDIVWIAIFSVVYLQGLIR